MAGLQRARRRIDDYDLDLAASAQAPDRALVPAKAVLQDNEPVRRPPASRPQPSYMTRPRIGTSPVRGRVTRKRRGDGTLLLRVLAVSTAVLILGTGGLLALHSMAPGSSGQAVADVPSRPAQVATAQAATAQAAARQAPAKPAAERPAAAKAAPDVIARRAATVASLLGAPAPAVASAPADGPADAAPTAADFARPAFLEPLPRDGDEQADETRLASADVPESTPSAASAPLPAPRPPVPDKAADSRSARIRSAVTLRSGPRRSASAIGTLAEGTRVTLYSCKSWCEVATADKRGFVYKNAVAR